MHFFFFRLLPSRLHSSTFPFAPPSASDLSFLLLLHAHLVWSHVHWLCAPRPSFKVSSSPLLISYRLRARGPTTKPLLNRSRLLPKVSESFVGAFADAQWSTAAEILYDVASGPSTDIVVTLGTMHVTSVVVALAGLQWLVGAQTLDPNSVPKSTRGTKEGCLDCTCMRLTINGRYLVQKSEVRLPAALLAVVGRVCHHHGQRLRCGSCGDFPTMVVSVD